MLIGCIIYLNCRKWTKNSWTRWVISSIPSTSKKPKTSTMITTQSQWRGVPFSSTKFQGQMSWTQGRTTSWTWSMAPIKNAGIWHAPSGTSLRPMLLANWRSRQKLKLSCSYSKIITIWRNAITRKSTRTKRWWQKWWGWNPISQRSSPVLPCPPLNASEWRRTKIRKWKGWGLRYEGSIKRY